MPMASPCQWHSRAIVAPMPYIRGKMRCHNCGKKSLANKQALRAHLRFCPRRPNKAEAVKGGAQPARARTRTSRLETSAVASSDEDDEVPLIPDALAFFQAGLEVGTSPQRGFRIAANYVILTANIDDPLSICIRRQWGGSGVDPARPPAEGEGALPIVLGALGPSWSVTS